MLTRHINGKWNWGETTSNRQNICESIAEQRQIKMVVSQKLLRVKKSEVVKSRVYPRPMEIRHAKEDYSQRDTLAFFAIWLYLFLYIINVSEFYIRNPRSDGPFLFMPHME